jgi:hypothetical protein
VFNVSDQSMSIAENSTGTLFTASASDADGDSLTYSLAGTDAARFSITSSGAVSLTQAANYDLPTDGNHDNIYDLTVQVSDGKATASIAAQITVTNDREGVSVVRVAQLVDTGAIVAPVAQSGNLLVVKSDGQMIQLDPETGSQTVIRNAFFPGESGRVLAAMQDRSWIFVMLAIDGEGTVVRFHHATNSRVSNPTPILATTVDNAATGSLIYSGGYFTAALGDPDGNRAQDGTSGFGKLFRLNFDPYCGASLLSACLTADQIGDGIHEPAGGGSYASGVFLFDRGTDQQDEITFYDQNARPLDFGWPAREGTFERVTNPPTAVNGPFLTYARGSGFGEGAGLVGGAVYAGAITSLKDKLIFGDKSGRILAAPASFMTDGTLHDGIEVEDRTEDFAPDAGSLGEPRGVLVSGTGRMYIFNKAGDLFRVEEN